MSPRCGSVLSRALSTVPRRQADLQEAILTRVASHVSWYNRTMDLKTIEREALGLTPANRAKLAHELLESLDALSPAEIDELWLDEAERRLKDLDEGRTQLVPSEEVYRKARALLK